MGKECEYNLLQFERQKISELFTYAKTADHACVGALHERLQTFASLFNKLNQGCTPITFGKDIKPNMEIEELQHTSKSFELEIEKRFERINDLNSKLNEAFELVTRTKHRNVRMIKYKLNDIDPSIIDKVRKKVLVHKV